MTLSCDTHKPLESLGGRRLVETLNFCYARRGRTAGQSGRRHRAPKGGQAV